MNSAEILGALRDLVNRSTIPAAPLLPDSGYRSAYEPIIVYLDQLQKGTKPETAAEGLFRALAETFLDARAIPQVGLGSGFVDFKLDAREESSIVIELKPLFYFDGADELKSFPLQPAEHLSQVQRYLQHSEYLILTDLRDAYLYSARDVWQKLTPFKKLSFADLLENAAQRRSLLDVIRDAEDGEVRPDLDHSFFEQLNEWFRAFASVQFKNQDDHDELVIQLLNQLIFAKTMEDYSLVNYRHLQDEFERAKEKWKAKGPHRIVRQFLTDFETFFNEYYDTELFERSIWEQLDPDDQKNFERFARLLEAVLGVDEWGKVFQRGIVHYNYRLINEDIFGKSYEMFLAADRKDEGIFYTPAGITAPMAESLVKSLCGPLVAEICEAVSAAKTDFKAADALMQRLSTIAIADTAAGSGGFLIKVLRAVWSQYQKIEQASNWVRKWKNGDSDDRVTFHDLLDTPPNVQQAREFRQRWNLNNRRLLVAQVLLRHVFAVDKDSGAIEVAKTNLWKEAVKLSSDDFNFRGLTGDIQRTLPSLRLNFICADSLVDVALQKQADWLAEYHRVELRKLSELRDRYIANPMDHAPLEDALKLRDELRAGLSERFQNENLPCEPGAFVLNFWHCWFAADGKPSKTPGFDGVIGNPPWEGFKPIRKEFAAKFHRGKPQFTKMGMDGPTFDKWFDDEQKKNAEFAAKWAEHEAFYERHKEYFGRAFKKQGTGDWNLFKLFIERDLSLVRQGGQFSLLVPSSIQTDEGCADLRRWFITENRLDELTSFENRGYTVIEKGKDKTKQIFPDVDSRFKFGFFKVVKGAATPKAHAFDARFYLHDPKDVSATPIRYNVEMLRRFSPEMFSMMEFRSPEDYAVASKVRGEHELLGKLGYQFRRELHPADDVQFYLKDPKRKLGKGESPIYEGKMIHQFDAGFAPRTFHAQDQAVREELLRKELHRLGQFIRESKVEKVEGKKVPAKKEEFGKFLADLWKTVRFQLDCDFERVVFRRIGSSTNERTIIATLLEAGVYLSDTVSYLIPANYTLTKTGKISQDALPAEEVRSVLCLLNSLTLNYYIRSKMSATVNMFYIYELPVPKLVPAHKKKLAESAGKLLKNPRDVKERAALEVFIARELYSLSRDDWQHLTGTFTFGSGETKAELDEIIRQSLALWA